MVTQYYSDASCTEPTYTEVRQYVLFLFLLFSFTYDKAICLGEIKSISVRIENANDAHMQSIVKECGSKLTRDFVDISFLFSYCLTRRTLSCTVAGSHPFADELKTVGSSLYRCIDFRSF